MALPFCPAALKQVHNLDKSSPDFPDQLNNVLRGEEYREIRQGREADEMRWLVNYLDQVLGVLDPFGIAFQKCLRELRSICGAEAILPTSYTLSSEHLRIDHEPFAPGDVLKGTLGCSQVCIKRRVDDGGIISKTFHEEAVIWKNMAHRNILPLLGVTIAPGWQQQMLLQGAPTTRTRFMFISNLMPGGTLLEHLGAQPHADRLGLLSDIAEGLHYLHSRKVIHRGIRGSNVLVDGSGRALIAGFGYATVVEDDDSVVNDSEGARITVRWTAPEIWNGGAFSKQTDIFSFSMLMIEVFTGAVPFGDCSDTMSMVDITQGRRPPRPEHPLVTGRLWKLMQCSWDQEPSLRPNATEVMQELCACNPPVWKKLIADTLLPNERIPLITSIFSDRDEREAFLYLPIDDAQAFIDVVDAALGTNDLLKKIHVRCLRTSYRVCGRRGVLPKSLQIPRCFDPSGIPVRSGGFADIWMGKHLDKDVAAKAVRVGSPNDLERTRKRFCREAMAWSTLRHPNVLPLLGVTMAEGRLVMVSEWMVNGNINEFLRNNCADRLELLLDVANGLTYMHDWGVIHGDLKGANIMIDSDFRARLADFSLVTLISDQESFLTSCVEGGTARWMGPELLDPKGFGLSKRHPTRESDCYALGMVVYEILSGHAPFNECSPGATIVKVLHGERPGRPQGKGGKLFTNGIWDMVERCWKHTPADRARAKDALRCLEEAPPLSRPASPGMDVDVGPDSDGYPDTSSDF